MGAERQVEVRRGGGWTGAIKLEGWAHGRDNPLGKTLTIAKLREKMGGENGWGQRRQKRTRGTGLQGLRGTLGSTSRAAKKRSSVTGGGGQ